MSKRYTILFTLVLMVASCGGGAKVTVPDGTYHAVGLACETGALTTDGAEMDAAIKSLNVELRIIVASTTFTLTTAIKATDADYCHTTYGGTASYTGGDKLSLATTAGTWTEAGAGIGEPCPDAIEAETTEYNVMLADSDGNLRLYESDAEEPQFCSEGKLGTIFERQE